MERLKTAVVGCGKVGRMHAKALKNLPMSALTAVCDSDLGRAQVFAREFGVQAYADIAEMAEKWGVQAAMVCTPHPIHAPPPWRRRGRGCTCSWKSRWPPPWRTVTR